MEIPNFFKLGAFQIIDHDGIQVQDLGVVHPSSCQGQQILDNRRCLDTGFLDC
jgi:hypothetical protein